MFEDETPEVIEQPVETQEVEPEQKKTVPLSKLLSEKEKRKALERELAELRKKVEPSEDAEITETLKGSGLDDDVAKTLARLFNKVKAKPETRDVIAEDLNDLSEVEFYDDAKAYEKEIRKVIADNPHLDVRDAYHRVRDISERVEELSKRRKVAPKAQPGSRPAAATDALTSDEKEAQKQLQRLFPRQNWSADEVRKYLRK